MAAKLYWKLAHRLTSVHMSPGTPSLLGPRRVDGTGDILRRLTSVHVYEIGGFGRQVGKRRLSMGG